MIRTLLFLALLGLSTGLSIKEDNPVVSGAFRGTDPSNANHRSISYWDGARHRYANTTLTAAWQKQRGYKFVQNAGQFVHAYDFRHDAPRQERLGGVGSQFYFEECPACNGRNCSQNPVSGRIQNDAVTTLSQKHFRDGIISKLAVSGNHVMVCGFFNKVGDPQYRGNNSAPVCPDPIRNCTRSACHGYGLLSMAVFETNVSDAWKFVYPTGFDANDEYRPTPFYTTRADISTSSVSGNCDTLRGVGNAGNFIIHDTTPTADGASRSRIWKYSVASGSWSLFGEHLWRSNGAGNQPANIQLGLQVYGERVYVANNGSLGAATISANSGGVSSRFNIAARDIAGDTAAGWTEVVGFTTGSPAFSCADDSLRQIRTANDLRRFAFGPSDAVYVRIPSCRPSVSGDRTFINADVYLWQYGKTAGVWNLVNDRKFVNFQHLGSLIGGPSAAPLSVTSLFFDAAQGFPVVSFGPVAGQCTFTGSANEDTPRPPSCNYKDCADFVKWQDSWICKRTGGNLWWTPSSAKGWKPAYGIHPHSNVAVQTVPGETETFFVGPADPAAPYRFDRSEVYDVAAFQEDSTNQMLWDNFHLKNGLDVRPVPSGGFDSEVYHTVLFTKEGASANTLLVSGQFRTIDGTVVNSIVEVGSDGSLTALSGGVRRACPDTIWCRSPGIVREAIPFNTESDSGSSLQYFIRGTWDYLGADMSISANAGGSAQIARYSSQAWDNVEGGCDGSVEDIMEFEKHIVVVGSFLRCGGVYSPGAAFYHPASKTWLPLNRAEGYRDTNVPTSWSYVRKGLDGLVFFTSTGFVGRFVGKPGKGSWYHVPLVPFNHTCDTERKFYQCDPQGNPLDYARVVGDAFYAKVGSEIWGFFGSFWSRFIRISPSATAFGFAPSNGDRRIPFWDPRPSSDDQIIWGAFADSSQLSNTGLFSSSKLNYVPNTIGFSGAVYHHTEKDASIRDYGGSENRHGASGSVLSVSVGMMFALLSLVLFL